jgi:hypothetical protein
MTQEQANNIYDINVSCIKKGVLILRAVENLEYLAQNGHIHPTFRSTSLEIPMDADHHDEVAYLLDCEYWDEEYKLEDWINYDERHTTDWLKEGDTPTRIKEWVEILTNINERAEA